MWFKNTKTGIVFEVDSTTTKNVFGERELKYKGLIDRLTREQEYVETVSPIEQAELDAEKAAATKELEDLRAMRDAADKQASTAKKTAKK